jgi:hypothetical protein
VKIPELAQAAAEALSEGRNISLTFPKGKRRMQGFPRGELLVENPDSGERVYSIDPFKILMWLKRAGLVEIRLTDKGKRNKP